MSGVEKLTREELIALVLKQHGVIEVLGERVKALEAELERLRSQLSGGGAKVKPEWVKPNRNERRAVERKKRQQSFVRRRETPTETYAHAVEHCPDCGRALSGGWVHRRRQVIEIPDTPVRIIEHVIVARRCGVCGKRYIPKVDLSGEVVGKRRIGLRLMSLVGHLHVDCRVTVDSIQVLLETLYGLHLGAGEISEILHGLAESGQKSYLDLLEEVRGSPAVNADETGWREDGTNGYIWSFSTPKVRYFVYNRSRSGDVPKGVLGEAFDGVVISDFYCGYSVLETRHQRCWVHFLRDLKALRDAHDADTAVRSWVEEVVEVYHRAKGYAHPDRRKRHCKRLEYEDELLKLAEPYVKTESPQRVLAERIAKFLPELFVFVEDPAVPSENNAAERAIRPAVIVRKVSGGTRSERGSATRMTLMSLFHTWRLRGLNTMQACCQMLARQPAA